MSVLLRGSLVLLASFIFVAIIAYQALSKKSVTKRAYTFLLLASTLFPFLDLGINVGTTGIKVMNIGAVAYLIFNLRPLIKVAKQYYLAIIYFAILVFTSLMSELKVESLMSIPGKLIGVIIFLAAIIAFNGLDEKNRLQLFAKYMKIPIYVIIFFGLVQIFIDLRFSFFYNVWDRELRVSSCFVDPQTAACGIGMLSLYLWNRYLNNRSIKTLVMMLLLLAIGLNTGSKAFFIGTLLGILTSFIFTRKKSIFSIVIIIVGFLLIVTQDYWGDMLIFERLSNTEGSMDFRREYFWMGAIEIFQNNWFTGIGSGVFRSYLEKHNIPMTHGDGVDTYYASQPESGYLLWLDELGIFSIIYIIIMLYFILKKNGNNHINLSIIVPWFIAFVSVYNFISCMLIYILLMMCAMMVLQTKNKTKKSTPAHSHNLSPAVQNRGIMRPHY